MSGEESLNNLHLNICHRGDNKPQPYLSYQTYPVIPPPEQFSGVSNTQKSLDSVGIEFAIGESCGGNLCVLL